MTTCTCPHLNVLQAVQSMCSLQRLESPFARRSGCQCLTRGGRLSRPLRPTQLCRSVTDPLSEEGCLMRAQTDKSLLTPGCYLGCT